MNKENKCVILFVTYKIMLRSSGNKSFYTREFSESRKFSVQSTVEHLIVNEDQMMRLKKTTHAGERKREDHVNNQMQSVQSCKWLALQMAFTHVHRSTDFNDTTCSSSCTKYFRIRSAEEK